MVKEKEFLSAIRMLAKEEVTAMLNMAFGRGKCHSRKS